MAVDRYISMTAGSCQDLSMFKIAQHPIINLRNFLAEVSFLQCCISCLVLIKERNFFGHKSNKCVCFICPITDGISDGTSKMYFGLCWNSTSFFGEKVLVRCTAMTIGKYHDLLIRNLYKQPSSPIFKNLIVG